MRKEFVLDSRLGIHIPELVKPWEYYTESERADIIRVWEEIRGHIPDRVKQLEYVIMEKQRRLDQEDHFPTSCRLNYEIAELASTINELHIWYRVNQDISPEKSHVG